MTPEEFEKLVAEALAHVPEKFAKRLKNVAILIEDTSEGGNLLGLYHGVPLATRGDTYGVGGTLPDTITLYRLPILAEAASTGREVAEVVRDTVWHEIAHYFGFDEHSINEREDEGSNRYGM
jgi:predicted Zn-dependent protease with MMP-like domain